MSTAYFTAGSRQRAANARTRQKLIARTLSPGRTVSPSLHSGHRQTGSVAAVGKRGETFRYLVATPWGDSSSTGRVGAVDRAAAEAIVRSLYPGHVLKSLERVENPEARSQHL